MREKKNLVMDGLFFQAPKLSVCYPMYAMMEVLIRSLLFCWLKHRTKKCSYWNSSFHDVRRYIFWEAPEKYDMEQIRLLP